MHCETIFKQWTFIYPFCKNITARDGDCSCRELLHLGSILYAPKNIYRENAASFKDIKQIEQLRAASTLLQKQADDLRPQTVSDREDQIRWLSWEEVLKPCVHKREST